MVQKEHPKSLDTFQGEHLICVETEFPTYNDFKESDRYILHRISCRPGHNLIVISCDIITIAVSHSRASQYSEQIHNTRSYHAVSDSGDRGNKSRFRRMTNTHDV